MRCPVCGFPFEPKHATARACSRNCAIVICGLRKVLGAHPELTRDRFGRVGLYAARYVWQEQKRRGKKSLDTDASESVT